MRQHLRKVPLHIENQHGELTGILVKAAIYLKTNPELLRFCWRINRGKDSQRMLHSSQKVGWYRS